MDFDFCFEMVGGLFYILTSMLRNRNNTHEIKNLRGERENLSLPRICRNPGEGVGFAFLWIVELRD